MGDQASYLRVHVPTGRLLGAIGQSHGYELERIDLFRMRLATRVQLREEVVVFRWPECVVSLAGKFMQSPRWATEP